jgi:hypothetical protein
LEELLNEQMRRAWVKKKMEKKRIKAKKSTKYIPIRNRNHHAFCQICQTMNLGGTYAKYRALKCVVGGEYNSNLTEVTLDILYIT